MKKVKLIMILTAICLMLAGCSIIKNPIAEEYSKETYIMIENIPTDSVYGITMHIMNGEDEIKSIVDLGIKSDNSDAAHPVGKLHFGIKKDSLPEGTEYSKLRLVFTIVESSGRQVEVDAAPLSFEFGTDYRYELVQDGEVYSLKKVD